MSNSSSLSDSDQLGRRRRQGVYWIFTIPHHEFTPYLPSQCHWIRGQLENSESQFLHWQFVCLFKKKQSLASVRNIFGPYHAELTKSDAATEYVWKELTRVEATQFELGTKPMDRSSPTDWAAVCKSAKAGQLDDASIPPDVFVRCYHSLRRIAVDYAEPVGMVRSCLVFWGPTGTGKSRRAWDEAGCGAYAKDPRTKWWCGYRNQSVAILDEFRGTIDISHLLRWLDRYPVCVETKGGSMPLLVSKFFITSNLHPRFWYPDLDPETYAALERRIEIIDF